MLCIFFLYIIKSGLPPCQICGSATPPYVSYTGKNPENKNTNPLFGRKKHYFHANGTFKRCFSSELHLRLSAFEDVSYSITYVNVKIKGFTCFDLAVAILKSVLLGQYTTTHIYLISLLEINIYFPVKNYFKVKNQIKRSI